MAYGIGGGGAPLLHTEPARRMAERRERVLVDFFEQLGAEARLQG